jgi:tetratricopeptide (TPR) repeat protein
MNIPASALALILLAAAAAYPQTDAQAQLALGHRLWEQRLSKSAIAAFEAATRDRATAAEAWAALGRIYAFKGWQQEGVFPGWHDETEYREKAIAAFEAALKSDPSHAAAAEGLKQANAFRTAAGVVPAAARRAEVTALDAMLEAWGGSDRPVAELEALLEKRTRLQADPAPYFSAAQMFVDRREFARATDLAVRGEHAATRFIDENEGAYKMAGKARGARARSRAAALDIRAVVALERMEFDQAARLLEEAERLTRGQDVAVQVHLGDLAMAQRDLERAQTHYVNALSLTGGAAPLRHRATEALMGIRASLEDSAGFDVWLEETVGRRRGERRAELLRSIVDRPLPSLSLTGLDGRSVDLAALRGKVLLLNFFSSW